MVGQSIGYFASIEVEARLVSAEELLIVSCLLGGMNNNKVKLRRQTGAHFAALTAHFGLKDDADRHVRVLLRSSKPAPYIMSYMLGLEATRESPLAKQRFGEAAKSRRCGPHRRSSSTTILLRLFGHRRTFPHPSTQHQNIPA
jgi:hypothetical protein